MNAARDSSRHGDVTVVVPCFDYGAYVGEAVASALAQTGGPPRIVVVDDGSTDPATTQALASLPEGAEVLHQANAGASAARNAGAAHTDTPFVLCLDADDKLTPDALDLLRAPLQDSPELAFSYGETEMFGESSGLLAFPEFDGYRLLYRSIVSATSLVRRSAWDAVGGFDPEVERYEDWDFYLGALERGLVGRRVDGITLLYRRHAGSKFEADRAGYRKAYRRLREHHSELFARSTELARQSQMGAVGRFAYRTYFAWRPIPAVVEQALYRALLFRRT